jgi:predicted RNA-binding protein YlqC (UPF0109 family)
MRLPEDEQLDFLRRAVVDTVMLIAQLPGLVHVQYRASPARVAFVVTVAQSDFGLVIGHEGSRANSIRDVVYGASKKTRYNVEIEFSPLNAGSAPMVHPIDPRK